MEPMTISELTTEGDQLLRSHGLRVTATRLAVLDAAELLPTYTLRAPSRGQSPRFGDANGTRVNFCPGPPDCTIQFLLYT